MISQSATQLKDAGMNQAVTHANAVIEDWSERAFDILLSFLLFRQGDFLCEDVREFAFSLGFPEAPSKRAWGAIIVRARKEGLITHKGYKPTNNHKAHKTPASAWSAA
jgi:hypothetical protein